MSGSNNQTIGQFLPASNVQPTDLIAGWQSGLKPATRSMTVQQIIDQVSGSFMPLTGGTLIGPGNLTVNGPMIVSNTSALNGDTSVGGNTTLSGTLGVAGATTLSGLMTAASVAISGGNIDGTIIGNTSRAAAFFTTINANSTANIAGTLTLGAGGTGAQNIAASGTGNLGVALGGPASLLIVRSGVSGQPILMRVASGAGTTAGQIISSQQLVLTAQDTPNPVWSGASNSAMTPLRAFLNWSGTSTVSGINTMLGVDIELSSKVVLGSSSAAMGLNCTVTTAAGHSGRVITANFASTQAVANAISSNYVALAAYATMQTNDGGVSGAPRGAQTGLNIVSQWLSGATFTQGGSGLEVDIRAQAGSYLFTRAGLLIDLTDDARVQGDVDDAAITIDAQSALATTNSGWKAFLQVGSYSGFSGLDPVNGVVINFKGHTNAGTVAGKGGFDFTNFSPTTFYMTDPGIFNLDNNGNWQAASYGIGSAGPTWTSGSGVPSATQPKGSFYTRTGGSAGSTFYVSQGGGTWNAVASV